MLTNIQSLLTNNKSLSWNKARLKCLSKLIRAFIKNSSVNLTNASAVMTNGTKAESEYRKAQRFFEQFQMPLRDIGALVLSKFAKPKKGWILAMDRTNWKFGETHINILTVGVVIKDIAIPIAWMVLPQSNKRGNSNTQQRIEVIEKVLQIMPAEDIQALTMDREFIGKKWLNWLDNQGVVFVVRLKKSHKVDGVAASDFAKRSGSNSRNLAELWGMKFYFASKKINQGRDPYLYVISNKFSGKEALRIYKQRWSIELLFSHLKKRGFNLEDTHLCEGVKIERLFGVVTLSFLASYTFGLLLGEMTTLTAKEKRKSVFRLGLDRLKQLFDSTAKSSYTSASPPLLEADLATITPPENLKLVG